MANGRLIGIGVASFALIVILVASYVSFGDRRADPPESVAPLGDAGSAPAAGVLNTDDQIDFWRTRVERDPRDYISYTELAASFLRRARETGDIGSFGSTAGALEHALELNPKYESALSYEASLLFARHDFDSALEAAKNIHSANPRSAHALAVIGDASLELGLYEEARLAYESLSRMSQSAAVYSRLAHLAELEGQPPKAIDLARNSVQQAMEDGLGGESLAWYHLQLGHLYFVTGEMDLAGEQYDASVNAFPGYVHGLAAQARVQAARGEYDDAISLYQEVTARQPVVEYVVALGDVYRAAGREDDARRQYDLVSAIADLYKANGVNTDLETALFFADHEIRVDDAVRQAQAIYAEQPGSIRAADVLSWALYKAGEVQEAAKYSKGALRLGTRDPLLLFHAGAIQYELGNREAARQYLTQVREINPNFSVLHAGEAARRFEELQTAVKN